ncbi:MAG TPA: protealysin inhibitor emfourin [Dermatophilaceae bacterium]|nr:protealysin inhibitor emfourin [Dermatophilaceae bacterium]
MTRPGYAGRPACSIIPPYLLRALAASGDPHLAAHAEATLRHDALHHRHRHGEHGVLPGARSRVVGPRGTPAGPSRSIHDAGGGELLPGRLVRAEGQPPTDDPAVTEAYDGLGATWELYATAYGRNSLDDRGLGLVATVHYGTDYDNAFWDGSQMVFGDGDGEVFLRFTRSVDVIGHELTHGVTQFTSGLNYQDQSGALNESVSDVFGVLTAQRLRGQGAAEAGWLVGADLLAPGVAGVALRSMRAPGTAYDDPRLGRDPQPSRMSGYVETTDDNGGVHINSGIPNHAFYLLATALGGNAWEVPGRIWYDTITGDIRADCDFDTFARLTVGTAERRHGAGSAEARAVEEAWREVEVLEPAAAATGPTEGSGDVGHRGRSGPSGEDASAVPTPETAVEVRRTGGVAGVTRQRTVTLGELPDPDTERWQRVLAQGVLRRLAARAEGAEHPDAFCYGVRCERPPVDVTIPEPALDHEVKALLDRTLRHRSPADPPTAPPPAG